MTSGIFVKIFGDVDFGVFGFVTVGGDFATDYDAVGLGGEFIYKWLFIFDLGTTNDKEKWRGGMLGGGGEIVDFFFEEQASVDGEMMLDSIGRSVGAVDDGEAILDVKVSLSCIDDVFDEIAVVGFFAWVETEVFEEDDFGVSGYGENLTRSGEGAETDFLMREKFAESVSDWCKRKIRIGVTFWATEMGN